ncbi:ParB/Srx family N-terminal domain-containing protein [Serratia fonticola]|uniref:ParB N-terminal domain-containing protein n=1 Tax=Serratia fonticola TaxID=47917 RepID=A0AAW3WTA9_SERFO|nr:ParB/Srx family N-terminal domain-containing protein [Serratia fonticola]MBC3214249.1 ParB N-terminal domain-containing protein [Serratia fonticola]NYA13640.1 ParB N-terminal domain-containing protein [Serratia fonticola]NYA35100.1 ParB N-terminal domain-containing protein [Serratia fonticola]
MTKEKDLSALTIVYRTLSSLIVYARNARTHTDEQVRKIADSIKEFGWTNPVLIDEKGEIIAGHGRVMAAEVLVFDEVPCIVLVGLSEQQQKAYRIADNKLPLSAGWDEDMLRLELADLLDADFAVSLTGFDEAELEALFADEGPQVTDEDPYTAKIDTPVYEPSEVTPSISELYDETKARSLLKNIKAAKLPKEVAAFLMSAAERHTVFNFNKIADYYANAPAEIQALFEESALVIIDYGQAIENGFVHMTKNMVDIVYGDEENGDA